MSKKLCAGVVFFLSIVLVFSAPSLRSQQVDEKGPNNSVGAEQDTLEKNRASGFDKPCEMTSCVTKFFICPTSRCPLKYKIS
jgi:hypothetical protein